MHNDFAIRSLPFRESDVDFLGELVFLLCFTIDIFYSLPSCFLIVGPTAFGAGETIARSRQINGCAVRDIYRRVQARSPIVESEYLSFVRATWKCRKMRG